jgi:O-antigen ligase
VLKNSRGQVLTSQSERRDHSGINALLALFRTPGVAFLVAMWAALWINLNTGPWAVRSAHGLVKALVFLRVYAPSGVLFASLAAIVRARGGFRVESPTTLLACYGSVAACAGVFSPDPSYATYWSCAYLASVGVARLLLLQWRPGTVAVPFLWSTWIAAAVVTAGVIAVGGGSVFAGGAESYGIEKRMDIISSGVARWGAVCALVALVLSIHVRRWWIRLLLLAVVILGCVIVYRMQSRGAIFGAVAALLFLLILNGRVGKWAIPLLVLAGLALALYDTQAVVSTGVVKYLERGGGERGLYTMTGRTNYYAQGWQAIQEAPLLGRGQWADRALGIGHIHNSFLQALLNGGFIGFVPYLLSWITGWRLFFRLWRNRLSLPSLLQLSLSTCGVVMAFLSLRAIPETTTASYSPDLLMMLAVYAFMEATATLFARPAEALNRGRVVWRQPRRARVAV